MALTTPFADTAAIFLLEDFQQYCVDASFLPGFAFTFNFSFLPFLRLRFPALTESFLTGFFMTWIRTFLLNPLAVVIVMTALPAFLPAFTVPFAVTFTMDGRLLLNVSF